jgi:WD40-like Beta Propeller Repeat
VDAPVKRGALLGALLLVLAGCVRIGGGGQPEASVGRHRLPTPQGSLFGTAWLGNGWIYFGHSVGLAAGEVWRVPAAGGQPQRLRLPQVRGCRVTEYLRADNLPDGRLGLARFCQAMAVGEPTRIDAGALDPRTGRYQPLAPLRDVNPSKVTWRADLRSGYVSHTSGICAGLAPLTRRGAQRFPLPVTLQGRTWRLEDHFFLPADEDCSGRGRADLPVLAPDGRRLYFLASPASMGVGGFARLDQPWDLYRWSPPGESPQALVRGLNDPLGLAIAPDGRSLALGAKRGRRFGLWLVNTADGSVDRLASGEFGDPSFSADGRHLVALLSKGPDHAELYVFDLP